MGENVSVEKYKLQLIIATKNACIQKLERKCLASQSLYDKQNSTCESMTAAANQLADALVMWVDSWRNSLVKGQLPNSAHWSTEDMARGDEAVNLAREIIANRKDGGNE